MAIELKKNCKYSLIVPTSMGVRITPVNGQPVGSVDTFVMQATSAESNVASISSYFCNPSKSKVLSVTGVKIISAPIIAILFKALSKPPLSIMTI